MSTIAVPSSTTNNSLLRLSVIGGLIIGLLHLIIQVGVVYDLLLKSPFIGSLQYVTSGVMAASPGHYWLAPIWIWRFHRHELYCPTFERRACTACSALVAAH